MMTGVNLNKLIKSLDLCWNILWKSIAIVFLSLLLPWALPIGYIVITLWGMIGGIGKLFKYIWHITIK
jgi:hypothetical protein